MPTNLDIPQLFGIGDYATIALIGDENYWQTYAALGLLSKTSAALAGLARFDDEQARLYEGVTHWIDGDDEAAAGALEKLPLPHAKNLLALIRKPRIHVLAQLPWYRQQPHNLLDAAAKDAKFKVRNVSFHQLDLPNRARADVHDYYDAADPPDFYISSFVEMQVMPQNLQDLPCPIFGVTADYDVHIQAIHPWLCVFDELIVAARKEWNEARQLTDRPVSTFPKLYGLAEDLPPVPEHEREIDFFLSGTLKHPYHPDKARLLHQALRMDGVKVRTIQGFVPRKSYNELMGHSKVGFAYVRHPDGMVTRALDALSMGCAVVVQRGSILALYAGEDAGVLMYDLDKGDLPDAIRRVCDNWSDFGARARKGAEIVRREFAESRVASQFLRYLAFLAAKPRQRRKKVNPETLAQKRLIIWKGPQIAPPAEYAVMRDQAVARGQARMKRKPDARTLIDMARELVMEYADSERAGKLTPASEDLLRMIFKLYGAGLKHMSKSLALRFNMIRAALHYGNPAQVADALQLADETLKKPISYWQVDPMEDVFSWDFFSSWFNYRDYFDLATRSLMEKKSAGRALASLMLASLHAYVGHYTNEPERFRQAMSLDPEFPFYQLHYAGSLIAQENPKTDQEAGEILVALAENSMLITEAVEQIEYLHACGRFHTERFAELVELADRDKQGSVLEGLKDETVRPLKDPAAQPAKAKANQLRLSALVYVPRGSRNLGAFINRLKTQTLSPPAEIVAVCAPGAAAERALLEEFGGYYPNLVLLPEVADEGECEAINRCVAAAKGNLLMRLQVSDVLWNEAFERLLCALDETPGAALVYADGNVARYGSDDDDAATVKGGYHAPDFNRRMLFQTCFVEPWIVWRKELHERYGMFAPEFGTAWDYEFWLRIAPKEKFTALHRMLGHRVRRAGEPLRTVRDEADCERAREQNWPESWGVRPGPQEDFFFQPSSIFSIGKFESELLGCWQALTPDDCRDATETIAIARSAVFRHDWLMAELALRAVMAVAPRIISARLMLSDAVRKQGRADEADEILKETLKINPYEASLRARISTNEA